MVILFVSKVLHTLSYFRRSTDALCFSSLSVHTTHILIVVCHVFF